MKHFANPKVLIPLLWRDFYVFGKRIKSYGVNCLIIFPLISIITFGYIQPGIYFGPGHSKASIALLIGMFTANMVAICSSLLTPFIFDFESERFIDYQISIFSPRLLLYEMLLFAAILTNIISLPFFPLARILLPSYFASLNPCWPALLAVIFCSSLFCAVYFFTALCIIKRARNIRQFWLRCNWPLMVLGGFWVPWYILNGYSKTLGYITLLNPFTYITEGLRSALIGSDQFIPYQICLIALCIYICILGVAARYLFKYKLDHV